MPSEHPRETPRQHFLTEAEVDEAIMRDSDQSSNEVAARSPTKSPLDL